MVKRLTHMVSCAGCASKFAAGELAQLLGDMPLPHDDRVLVDFRTSDDAGVYKWEAGPALVQTVDFFTPIVDDPYTFGEIAAANAVSDIYAMGGRPLTALAVAAFPKESLDREDISSIFRGGLNKLKEAGAVLLGGHTVQDPEIKFGYAVTGSIDPARVFTNAGARVGDVLFLTKPLGTGIIATAMKFDRADPALGVAVVQSMRTLNRAASQALQQQAPSDVHACTDVTGFGLIGHASEVAAASGVAVAIDSSRVPVFPGAERLALENRSGGLVSNEQHRSKTVRIVGPATPSQMATFYDPQTSGGLLIAVEPSAARRVQAAVEDAGVPIVEIGEVLPAERGVLVCVR